MTESKKLFLVKGYFKDGGFWTNVFEKNAQVELTPSLEQTIIEAVEKEHVEDYGDNHALQGCHRCHLNIFKALRDLVSEEP